MRFLLGEDALPQGWPEDQGVKTLGFDVLAWSEAYLAQPDGDTAGMPWQWRMSQARFVAWWYAVDEQGKFLFRRAQVVLPKGAGKSPMAAALACCELGGPVVFDHFDDDGEPVGRPHPSPWVQLAAVNEKQSDNTMLLVTNMLNEGTAREVIPGMDPGIMRVRTANGLLERLTASPRAGEGGRPSTSILDESHHWLPSNGGTKMAEVIRRNLGKTRGRSIETTNCWNPGEDSVAETTYNTAMEFLDGRSEVDQHILRWHPSAPVEDLADTATLRAAIEKLYADAPWVDVDRVIAEVYDTATHPADARRFYLNEVTSADDALVTDFEWSACQSDEIEPLKKRETITLGFDGGKTDDSTALVGIRVSDRAVFVLGLWERPLQGPARKRWDAEGGVRRDEVNETVLGVLAEYDVAGFYGDVALWESYIDAWSALVRSKVSVKANAHSAVGWDMRGGLKELTLATERLVAAIRDGEIKHNGDMNLRRHVLNTRRRVNQWGTSFGKESRESPNKVDIFSAMQLADMARYDFVQSGKRRGSGSVVVW